jgi:hypothetical protein
MAIVITKPVFLVPNLSYLQSVVRSTLLCSIPMILTPEDMPNSKTRWTMAYEVPADPVSPFSVKMVKDWIDNCVSNHEVCKTSAFASTLPSRVIDLGPPDSTEEPHLVDSSLIPGLSSNYATLSHCWGQVERTTTTTNSLAKMKECIPISSLSPTFRDAVLVANTFNIRYLWIDSLCIVQDSLEDWTRESTKMAGIFANSFLTIAGPSSTNSQEGFLMKRSSGLHYVQLDDPVSHLHLRKRLKSFKEEIQNSSLNRRAWVFQEIQLSKRVLYYGMDKIIWKCWDGWCREDLTPGFDMAFTPQSETLFHGHQNVTATSSKRKTLADEESLISRTNWYHLVDEYSRKELTFLSDKLPALSAVAQEVGRLTRDTYLAGLWKSDLINGQLWQRALGFQSDILLNEMKDFRPTKAAGTPSWSWAAYDGFVDTEKWRETGSDIKELATVKDARVELFDSSYPTGQVKSGTILLSGYCQEFEFSDGVTKAGLKIIDNEGRVRMEDWERAVIINDKVTLTIVFDLDEERDNNGPVLCLLMTELEGAYVKRKWMQEYYRETERCCLILRASDIGDNQWKRVGVGVLEGEYKVSTSTGWEQRTLTLC